MTSADDKKIEEELDRQLMAAEKKRSGVWYWATLTILIGVAIFLLLVFWPTGEDDRPQSKEPVKPGIIGTKFEGSIGMKDAEYIIKGKSLLFKIDRRKARRGVAYLKVDLKVRNMSTEPRALQHSMIRLLMWTNGKEIPTHGTLTDLYYNDTGKPSPWGQWIDSSKSVDASAFFIIPLAPNKMALRLYSFDWTLNDHKEVAISGLKDMVNAAVKENKDVRKKLLKMKTEEAAEKLVE